MSNSLIDIHRWKARKLTLRFLNNLTKQDPRYVQDTVKDTPETQAKRY